MHLILSGNFLISREIGDSGRGRCIVLVYFEARVGLPLAGVTALACYALKAAETA